MNDFTNKQTTEILTSKGTRVEVKTVPVDESAERFLSKSEYFYCLTCGAVPDELDQLEIIPVGENADLKEKLNEREHPATNKDNVSLCVNCLEELLF